MINKKEIRYLLLASIVTLGIIGCGEVFDKVEDRPAPPAPTNKGHYLDSNVSGIHYISKSGCKYVKDENDSYREECKKTIEGTTYNGVFGFIPGGEGVKFSVAELVLDYIPPKYLVQDAVLTVRKTDGKLASFLQSMDSDANASNGINISTEVVKALTDLNVSGLYKYIDNSSLDISTLVQQVNEKLNPSPRDDNKTEPIPLEKKTSILKYVSESDALEHLQSTISAHTPLPSITVEKFIDDIKDISDNAKEYSQEEIEEKVKALRTTLNNPLEGDRGLTDIEIAKTLLDLSELTNEGYLEDVFVFKGSVDSHLSQIIKEMALDNNTPDEKRIVLGKEENSTNVIADSRKAIGAIVTKLKTISDNLGASLATAPQYYRFKYEGIDISLDNIQALRSVLLATASKLSLTLAYDIGQDSDYIPKFYTDANGSKYEYKEAKIYRDKLLNRDGFGVANSQSALNEAKNYLMQSAMIIKDLDPTVIREDLNETSTESPTEEERNNHQDAVTYARNLYKVLSDNNGTFTISNDNGGDNGEKEEFKIAINRLFDDNTAPKITDFGSDFAYQSCPKDFNVTTDDEIKKYGKRFCYPKDLSHEYEKWDYSHYCELDIYSKNQPTSETSGLDELITQIKVGEEVKEGEEVIQYLELNSSSVREDCGIPYYYYQPKFTYEKVASRTYYLVDENGQTANKAIFSALGTNTLKSSPINETPSTEISFSIENGKLIFTDEDKYTEHTLLEESVNGLYDRENIKSYYLDELQYETNSRLYYQKSDAEAFLGQKRNFKYIGSDTSILTAPNGGEVVRTNDNVSITWNRNKITTSGVKLYVLDDDPTDLYSYSTLTDLKSNKHWTQIGGISFEDNDGSYTPTTEELLDRSGDAYIILITSEDEKNWDVSDSTFSINP